MGPQAANNLKPSESGISEAKHQQYQHHKSAFRLLVVADEAVRLVMLHVFGSTGAAAVVVVAVGTSEEIDDDLKC